MRCESRKSDLEPINPSLSHHTELTMHLCSGHSGYAPRKQERGFEIGELTSISSPCPLAQKSQLRLHPLSPPSLLGSNPRSPLCFPFSSAYPPLFGLSDRLKPCLGESLHLTKGSENGCPYSVIPASRPAGGRPGAYYIPLLSIVCLYLETGLSWQGQRLPISGQKKSGQPLVTCTIQC